ncbi:MAG: inositol monophosphatase family protein [Peptococcaceae bacterium]
MKKFIENITKKAGDTLIKYFREDRHLLNLRSTAKEAITKYDKEIDNLIIKEVKSYYPHHSLLTEEGGLVEGDPDWLWVVDSLDGTGNFANFNPFFCVCIALKHKNDLLLGAIYAPAIDEFYLAEKEKGAYLNGKRIHVSRITDLNQAYLIYCEGGEKDRDRTGNILSKVYPYVTDMRKLGSAGIEAAWVAAGRGDAYYTTKIEPWDVAAGVLLVQEAGGKVSDFQGNPWKPITSDLLFSNGKVHQNILNLISGT